MLVNSDLGFRVAAWVCFLGLLLLFFLVRRKWRLYAARQVEIRRLVVLAAEEAARAELEAVSIGCGAPPPVVYSALLPVNSSSAQSASHYSSEERFCAVCGRPTTTRCAKCKSVRYCSGKCQIVHWRQGHKHDCHPPEATFSRDEGFSIACDVAKSEHGNPIPTLQSGRRKHIKPSQTSIEEPKSYDSRHYPELSSKKDDGDEARFTSEYSRISGSSESFALFSGEQTCIDDSASEDGSLHDFDASDEDCHRFASSEHSHKLQRNKEHSVKFSGVKESVSVHSCANGIKVGETKNRSQSSGNLLVEPSTLSSGFWDGSLDSRKTKKYERKGKSSFQVADDVILSNPTSTLQFSFSLPENSSSGMHSQGSKKPNVGCRSPSGFSGPVSKATSPPKVSLRVSKGRASISLVSENLSCVDRNTNFETDKIQCREAVPFSTSGKDTFARDHSVSNGLRPVSKATSPQKVSLSVSKGRASISLVTENLSCVDRKTNLETDKVLCREAVPSSTSRKDTSARDYSVSNVLQAGDLPSNDSSNAFCSSTSGEVCPSQTSSKALSSAGKRGHTSAAVNSSVVDKYHANATMPCQGVKVSTNANVGLKTSMMKVVDQFRGSKLPKHSLGAGNDNLGKSGEKGLFPYDLFVKLYNWDQMDFSPCGLVNCGNSCYANAVLQCLAFTPPLTAYFLQGLHSKTCVNKEWCFSCKFEQLILKAKEVGSAVSPIDIVSQIQKIGSHLAHGREEDAHEFLRHAVDSMYSVCLREAGLSGSSSPFVEETTLIGLTFGGYIRSKIRCMKCCGKSEIYERMMDLTVEIEGDIKTLEEALQKFTMTESLDGENKYQCSRCKTYEKARKKLTIVEAPNILTIALKRYQSGKFGKLNKAIQFPEILDLAPYMRGSSDKSPIFRLYGVVVHLDIKNAAFSGHYVCYVRNAQNKWFKADDSKVKPVVLDRVLKKGAYMLFYSRCSPRAPKSIRNTIISREPMIKMKHPDADPSCGAGRASSLRSGDRPAHTSHHISNGHSNYDYGHPAPRALNVREVDSSSDSSSLFSHSDEVSTSTDARESTSADDPSEYIFGDMGSSNNTYWVHSSDSDASSSSSSSSSSPLYTRHSPLSKLERLVSGSNSKNVNSVGDPQRESSSGSLRTQSTGERAGVSILHSDSAKAGRKVVVNNSSSNSNSSRETDSGRVVGALNPLDDAKSGLYLRKPSRIRD